MTICGMTCQEEAVESMELLDRLSSEVNVDGSHVEHGSVATRSGHCAPPYWD